MVVSSTQSYTWLDISGTVAVINNLIIRMELLVFTLTGEFCWIASCDLVLSPRADRKSVRTPFSLVHSSASSLKHWNKADEAVCGKTSPFSPVCWSAPGTGCLFLKMVCDTPRMIRVKLWGRHQPSCGQESQALRFAKHEGCLGQSWEGKNWLFLCKYSWAVIIPRYINEVGFFFVRVDIRKSNFHGQPENLRVKGKAWNMLDYPCASKFTLYVKATHNRNTINKRRKKKVHFCPTHPPL